jgi:hypothetical protein
LFLETGKRFSKWSKLQTSVLGSSPGKCCFFNSEIKQDKGAAQKTKLMSQSDHRKSGYKPENWHMFDNQ